MTVKEMINYLRQFDGNREVIVGEQQRYGSDFAYSISDIDELPFESFKEWEEEREMVVINLGRQIGTIDYE